jgi:Fur family ferric uptake transcriptional regulator
VIVEFADAELERLQEEMAQAHGFVLVDHRHELFGVCSDCRAAGETKDSLGDSC